MYPATVAHKMLYDKRRVGFVSPRERHHIEKAGLVIPRAGYGSGCTMAENSA